MIKDMAAINEEMANYRRAVRDRRIADFDVTLIEGLKVLVDVNEMNLKGTLLTFKHLRGLPVDQRNALLGFISDAYAVNFGMPEGVTWENGIPESRNIFDANLMD